MAKFFIAGHDSFYNRGCEALVRSIVTIMRTRLPDASFVVPSTDIDRDVRQWPDAEAAGVSFVPAPRMPQNLIWWSRLYKKMPSLAGRYFPVSTMPEPALGVLRHCDAMIVTGGDIMSLDYSAGSLLRWVSHADTALRLGKPVALWASSLGPFSKDPRLERFMACHLRSYASISTRESNSQAYATSLGLEKSVQTADPAFVLRPEAVDAEAILPAAGEAGILGFNTSPLIAMKRNTLQSVAQLENDILDFWRMALNQRGLSILLLPHVDPLDGSIQHSDSVYMAKLLERMGDTSGRIRLAPRTLNAAQLKFLISHCRYFIGARTHSTVAALSTGVPTLSIAYSVKAKGINRDLFGDLRYMLDTPDVSLATLSQGLDRLVVDEGQIKAVLTTRIPEWREKAAHTGDLVASMLA